MFAQSDVQDIPDELKVNFQGNKFFQYDGVVHDSTRFIILKMEKEWIYSVIWNLPVAGATKVAHLWFYQNFTGIYMIFCRFLPLIYVFIGEKSEESNRKVFNKIIAFYNLTPDTYFTF